MKLVIISGRSGSGKSTALHVLEDAGYYTIDNLPAGLLIALVEEVLGSDSPEKERMALCIDARNTSNQLQEFPNLLACLPASVDTSIIYLDAHDDALIKRFSETRRRHPLSDKMTALQEALVREREILQPIANSADITIDTSQMLFHELRDYVQQVVLRQTGSSMSTLIQSFGFKKGLPLNADLVFDVRCLPNPHWVPTLRSMTGAAPEVIAFLQNEPAVEEMIFDMVHFLEKWLPRYEGNNRPYTTVAVGCTGGQHRSVYIANRLYQHFSGKGEDVQVRHREIVSPYNPLTASQD